MASKITNLDAQHDADARLVELGRELISEGLGTEIEIYEGFSTSRISGALSIRGIKATIEAINEIGALPSIAVTSVQYFEATDAVRALEGGKDQPLVKVIGVATQGTRKMGKKDFMAKVAQGGSYSTLAKFVEKLPAKESAGGAGSVKVTDIDGAMAQFLTAIAEFEDITPKNLMVAKDFFAKADAIKLATRANHPAVQSKGA
jgi:hypothetical protein